MRTIEYRNENLEMVRRKLVEKLEKVPEAQKPKLYKEAVIENPEALQFVPPIYRTYKMWLIAVSKKSKLLQFLPSKFKIPEFYKEAVIENPEVLQFVPKKFKTPKLCLEAVKKAGWVLQFVPENLRTYELCLEAVKHRDRTVLRYVPVALKAKFRPKFVNQNIEVHIRVSEVSKPEPRREEAVKAKPPKDLPPKKIRGKKFYNGNAPIMTYPRNYSENPYVGDNSYD